MEFMVNIDLKKIPRQMRYGQKTLLIGSCFTEHIGNALRDLKFPILQNPHGILFDPASVGRTLQSYVHNRKYTESDFFQLNDVWNSWDHHSRYSHVDLQTAVTIANKNQQTGHEFLKNADWLIITLGSSFSYRLTNEDHKTARFAGVTSEEAGVANCHRAPAQWFDKYLLESEVIYQLLIESLNSIISFNPKINVILTISPVRHIRDGVVENNRSKARLIESVHQLVSNHSSVFYFPAYELVIDVLRDYRFYDVDLVHPNYMATEYVLEKFEDMCIDDESKSVMTAVKELVTARRHKPLHPDTQAHQQFLRLMSEKTQSLHSKYPHLDLNEELKYFSS